MKKICATISCALFAQCTFSASPQKMEEIFSKIYENNSWGESESVSGPGSSLQQTRAIRMSLPSLLKTLQVETMLDAPCGDFHWMKEVDLSFLSMYIGADIVFQTLSKKTGALSRASIEHSCI